MNILKIKKPIRFIIFVSLMISILFSLISKQNQSYSYDSPKYKTLVVSEGDTLWSICSNIHSDRDIRQLIKETRNLNNMESNSLYVGQELIIME